MNDDQRKKKDRKASQARIDANKRYREKTYDNLSVAVPKGKRDYYKQKAKELGYDSFNKFVISAMDKEIERG